MISFDIFSEMVNRWIGGYKEIEKFEEALKPFCDSHPPILNIASDALRALEELILISCGLDRKSDLISWWAFEDVEKIITTDDGKEYNVSTMKQLYHYIAYGKD